MTLCGLQAQEPEEQADQGSVMQTYTVPLSVVKASVEEWIPSVKEEYLQLTERTGAIIRRTEEEVKALPRYSEAEYAPCTPPRRHLERRDQG